MALQPAIIELMKNKRDSAIKKLVSDIVKEARPEKIILFGSAAFGKFTSQSDIDICIIKEGDSVKIKRQVWDMLWKSGYNWNIEPDIHVYNPQIYQKYLSQNDPFIKEIAKGKVLYG